MVSQAKSSVILSLFLCALTFSCKKGDSELPSVKLDILAVPLMHTEGVSSLISDSGITRYRLNVAVWDMYSDNVEEPYWHFPKGFYLEKFDSLFNVEANVKADTAYNYEKRGLWRLVGNVKIENLQGHKFETSELFWDLKSGMIYSDKPIRVEEKGGRIDRGIGFRSNQEMSYWRILKYTAEIPLDEVPSDNTTGQVTNSSP